jgi:hypothetical protein
MAPGAEFLKLMSYVSSGSERRTNSMAPGADVLNLNKDASSGSDAQAAKFMKWICNF